MNLNFDTEFFKQIEECAESTDFSGVLSLSQGKRPLFRKAYGYRDAANAIPLSPDTRLGIASGTKLFTALGIGKLIETEKLTLNTKVSEISGLFTGFIDPRATIRQLLNHTSGMYDYYDEDLIEDFDNFFLAIPWYQLMNPTDYFPLFKNQKYKFPAGERFSYSNGGFVLLGMIIEKLSGQTYGDFMQSQILTPAGMVDSGFFSMNKLPRNTAIGYMDDRETANIFNLPIKGGGDGGMYTTADDLISFWDALFNDKILKAEIRNEFLKTCYEFNDKMGYGLGIYKRLDSSLFAIIGSDAGVGLDSRYIPSEKITISILSNITDGEKEVKKRILDFILS